jgi:ATP-dependent helicase HrpB
MSATIDGARFAGLLGNAPVIERRKAFPLAIRWLGARPDLRLEQAMASAIGEAWRSEQGISWPSCPACATSSAPPICWPIACRRRWCCRSGQVEPAGQRTAIRRDAGGRRRIVLATAIAETSLTLDGVSVVVDAGLSRRAEFDKTAGVTRLVTHRASQAAAAQRAGRAARQGPGVAYRLWEEAAHAGRPAFDPPEILTSDLAPLALTLAQWGAGDPAGMAWIDPPPAPAMAAAQAQLRALGALDADNRITARPRLGEAANGAGAGPYAVFAAGAARRGRRRGWRCCCRSAALAERARIWRDGSIAGTANAAAGRRHRANWRRAGRNGGARLFVHRLEPADGRGQAPPPGVLLAEAFPDRIARRRSASGEEWLSSGGAAIGSIPHRRSPPPNGW